MHSRTLAITVLCSACGSVVNPTIDGAVSDGTAPTTYHGTVAQTSPVTFGGAPECTYTVTLRQIDIQIGVLPSGQVTSGQVQALYDEALVSTCGHPAADPTISSYTFASAMTNPNGSKTLTFQEELGDKPGASLVVGLSMVGVTYQVQLTFHRTDEGPPLNWTVIATTSLSAQ